MSLPTLKQYIYSCMDSTTLVEAMLNVMQATFVTLQSAPALDRDILLKSQQTFFTLFSRYFLPSTPQITVQVNHLIYRGYIQLGMLFVY